MQHDNFGLATFRSAQCRFQRIKRIMRAYGNQNVAWLHVDIGLRQLRGLGEIKFVQFEMHLLAALTLNSFFRDLKSREQKPRERDSRHRSGGLREEIYGGGAKKNQRDQNNTHR